MEDDHLEHFRCVEQTIVSLYVRIISLHDTWKIHVAFGCHNLGFANVAAHVRDHGINFNRREKFFVHDRVVQKTRLFKLGSAGLLAVKPIVN